MLRSRWRIERCRAVEGQGGCPLMAAAAEVVAAIDHITRYKPDWRGTLNDADFNALNDMYQRAKHHPEEWLPTATRRQPSTTST